MEWISVKDDFPKKGTEVLVWFGDSPEPYMAIWQYDDRNRYFRKGKPMPFRASVTHWAPRPDPPEAPHD